MVLLSRRKLGILALTSLGILALAYSSVVDGPESGEDFGCRDCNVVLIVVDAARLDHFGLYGYPKNTTPNIDRLAGKSVVFENAISQATWTKPSVASLFTSLYPTRHTANGAAPIGGAVPAGTALPKSHITLAETFKSRGYSTFAVVTNNHISAKAGFGQGFDSYLGCTGDACVTDKAVKVIEGFKGGRFFMYLHYLAPHMPYSPRQELRGKFVEPKDEPVNTSISDFRVYLAMNLTGPQLAYVISQYDAEIFFDDMLIGRLISRLESAGLGGNTIVVITADHGEDFLDLPGAFGHIGAPYDTQVRVPLIMSIPNATPGRVVQQVRLIDVMPTLIDLTGGTSPGGIDGVSLVPAVQGKQLGLEAYSEKRYTRRWNWLIGYRGKGIKCIVDVNLNGSLGRTRAYNLTVDPHEHADLADNWKIRGYCQDKVGGYLRANSKPGKPAAANSPKPGPKEAERLKSLGYVN